MRQYKRFAMVAILLFISLLLSVVMPLSADDSRPRPTTDTNYLIARAETVLNQQQTFNAYDAQANDDFGEAVVISGNYAVIGAPGDNSNTGAIYIFERRSDGIWDYMTKISGHVAGERFGESLDMQGLQVIIGAPDSNGGKGAAYIYYGYPILSGGDWSYITTLTASDGQENDHFGRSVAYYSPYMLVGAPGYGSAGQGAVYIFDIDMGLYTLSQKFVGDFYNYLGEVVAMDGNSAMSRSSGVSNSTRKVNVYTNSNGNWSKTQELIGDPMFMGVSQFGTSIALDGDTAVIGDSYFTTSNNNPGVAYIFTRSNNSWSLQQILSSSDGFDDDRFGYSVALDGNIAVIGAYSDNSAIGSTVTFVRVKGTWVEQNKLTPNPGSAGDQFGRSVAVSGSKVLVGSPFRNSSKGAAYIFETEPTLNIEMAKIETYVYEGNSDLTNVPFTVLVNGGITSQDHTIQLKAQDSSTLPDWATANASDYTQSVTTFTVPAGDYRTTKTLILPKIAISIVGDTPVESDELMYLDLINPDEFLKFTDIDEDSITNEFTDIYILNDDPGTNVLVNGSFEGDKIAGIPVGWSGSNTTTPGKDKQKCDQPQKDKVFAIGGTCALMFKGNGNDTLSKIKQTITNTSVFAQGARVMFGALVDNRSALVDNTMGKVVIKYNNNTKDKLVVKIPSGNGYTLTRDSITLNLAGRTVSKVKAQFQTKLTSGKFFIDDARLTVMQPSALREMWEALPLPDVPGSFRD